MQIKFSILGCGHIGKRHAHLLHQNTSAKLTGLFDIDRQLAQSIADETGADFYSDFDQLCNDDSEIVSVCTPSGLHKEHSIALLKAGKHVLVEKPMALSYSDALEMQKEAVKCGKQLFVVKQNRYNPPVQWLKKKLDSGDLGRIFQVVVNCYWNRNKEYYSTSNWKGKKSMDGGVLYNQFSHFIDILYYLFGEIKDCKGLVQNVAHKGITEFEDSGSISFVFEREGHGSINFTTASFDQNMEGSIAVFAEKATVKIGGKYLNAVEYLNSKNIVPETLPLSAPANNYGYYEGSMSNHHLVFDNVIKSLRGEEAVMTPAADGVEVVKMIGQLYEGAKR